MLECSEKKNNCNVSSFATKTSHLAIGLQYGMIEGRHKINLAKQFDFLVEEDRFSVLQYHWGMNSKIGVHRELQRLQSALLTEMIQSFATTVPKRSVRS